jgi:hypothetical protein
VRVSDNWDELRELGIEVEAATYEAHLLKPKHDIGSFRVDTTLIDHGYFLHGPRNAGKVTTPQTWEHEKEGKKEIWTVTPDVKLGFPKILEKKVLRGLEMFVTEYIDAFGVVPQYLPFRIKTLAEMVHGRRFDIGGKDIAEIRDALSRLHLTVLRVEKEGEEVREFRVLEELISPDKGVGNRVDDLTSYHVIVFGKEFMNDLENNEMEHQADDYRTVASLYPIALALYEKFELDFSRTDDERLRYEYETLCKYLGIMVHKVFYKAQKPYIKALVLLKQMGKISDWALDSKDFSISVKRPV